MTYDGRIGLDHWVGYRAQILAKLQFMVLTILKFQTVFILIWEGCIKKT